MVNLKKKTNCLICIHFYVRILNRQIKKMFKLIISEFKKMYWKIEIY